MKKFHTHRSQFFLSSEKLISIKMLALIRILLLQNELNDRIERHLYEEMSVSRCGLWFIKIKCCIIQNTFLFFLIRPFSFFLSFFLFSNENVCWYFISQIETVFLADSYSIKQYMRPKCVDKQNVMPILTTCILTCCDVTHLPWHLVILKLGRNANLVRTLYIKPGSMSLNTMKITW